MKLHRYSIATVGAMLLLSLTMANGALAADSSSSSTGTSTPTSTSTPPVTTSTHTPPVTTTSSTPPVTTSSTPPVTTTTSTPPVTTTTTTPPTTAATSTPPVVNLPDVPVSPDVTVPKTTDIPQAPAARVPHIASGAGELPFTGPGDVVLAVVIALLAGMGGTLLLMGAASREEIDGLNQRTLASASGFRVAYRELLKRQVGE